MSHVSHREMAFSLQQATLEQLRGIADDLIPAALQARALPDALPPPFVAARSVSQLAAGKSALWCSTFLIVRDEDNAIVGGCGFKDEPKNGRVEIGYGVAPACRRKGAATAAIRALLSLAFANGATEVLAEVLPTNEASASSVRKLGFVDAGTRDAEDGETVIQWLATRGT